MPLVNEVEIPNRHFTNTSLIHIMSVASFSCSGGSRGLEGGGEDTPLAVR